MDRDDVDVPVEVRAYREVERFVTKTFHVTLSLLTIRRTDKGLQVSAHECGGRVIQMRERCARRIINLVSRILGTAAEIIREITLDRTFELVEYRCDNGPTRT